MLFHEKSKKYLRGVMLVISILVVLSMILFVFPSLR
jgi:hypothetical protein